MASLDKVKQLSSDQQKKLFGKLKTRFETHIHRHQEINWETVQEKLEADPRKLWSLFQMEETGGEPDVIGFDAPKGEYVFCDCSPESPKGRRSLCYDRDALEARKKHKPENSAEDSAAEMGIEILSEAQYRELQKWGEFDKKTSTWVKTPTNIRKLGGALFCDFRYGRVFVYHNGADSYYASRGFRGFLSI